MTIRQERVAVSPILGRGGIGSWLANKIDECGAEGFMLHSFDIVGYIPDDEFIVTAVFQRSAMERSDFEKFYQGDRVDVSSPTTEYFIGKEKLLI